MPVDFLRRKESLCSPQNLHTNVHSSSVHKYPKLGATAIPSDDGQVGHRSVTERTTPAGGAHGAPRRRCAEWKKPVYTATCPTTPSIGRFQEDKAAVTDSRGLAGVGGVYVLRPDWLGWSSHGSTHMLKLIGLYLKHRFYYRIQNNIKIVNVKTHCLQKLPPHSCPHLTG